jgi:hypothetical protein
VAAVDVMLKAIEHTLLHGRRRRGRDGI